MPKILAPTVRPYDSKYTPLSTRRGIIVQKLAVVRNESVNHIALPSAPNTVFPSAAPQALMQYGLRQDFQGASSTSFPPYLATPYPAIAAPIDASDADVQFPTAVNSATQVAALHFSPEAAEVVVEHLAACFPENLTQPFLDLSQPVAGDAGAQKRITELVRIGLVFTLPEVIHRACLMRTDPLLTPAGLEHLFKLMLKTIDAPGFLSVRNPYQSQPLRTNQVMADRHKVFIVMLALLHFVCRDDATPFNFSLTTLARCSRINPHESTLERLYFDYRWNKPELEQILDKHKNELDLAGARRWTDFMLEHNHQQRKTIALLQRYDNKFKALPPRQVAATVEKAADMKGNFNFPVVRKWATFIDNQNYRLENTRNHMRGLEEECKALPPRQVAATVEEGADRTRSGTFKIVEGWYVLELPDASQPD